MIDRKKLDADSGFQQRFVYITPYLKFNGQEGHFTLIDRNEKNEIGEVKELGKKVRVVLLKRGRFKLFALGLFTNEGVPNRNDVVNLYEKLEDKRKRMIDTGPWKDLKVKHNLKTKQLPYVLLLLEDSKKIAKMGVLPSSLMNYWEYQKSFGKDERPYEFITEIFPSKAKSKGGKSYFKMNFAKIEKVEDLEEIAKEVEEVADNVKREEESFVREDNTKLQEMKKASDGSKDGIPIINEDGEGGYKAVSDKEEKKENGEKKEKKSVLDESDEIDVDKIPF